MYSYENFTVSEATKRVYRAEAIERIYDNLTNACEQFKADIDGYEERLREKEAEQKDAFVRVDNYEYRESLTHQARYEVYKAVAKELLKL